MFVGMIGSSATIEVISSGTGGSRNDVLQLVSLLVFLFNLMLKIISKI